MDGRHESVTGYKKALRPCAAHGLLDTLPKKLPPDDLYVPGADSDIPPGPPEIKHNVLCMWPNVVFLSSIQALETFKASFTRASVRSLRAKMRCRFGAQRGLLEGDARSRFLACANTGNASCLRPVVLEIHSERHADLQASMLPCGGTGARSDQ